MKRILILCTHNSARSQMGEAWLRYLSQQAKLEVEAWSAGTEKTRVKPEAAQVMGEVGIDLASHFSKTVEEVPDRESFDAVLTVCDSAAQTCPLFPGSTRRYHVSLPDPSGHDLQRWRASREQLRAVMRKLVASLKLDIWPSEDDLIKEVSMSLPTVKVFDPPMCCSTGVCGVNVDPKLSQLAADLAHLKTLGVAVERHNLGTDPGAFARHPEVLAAMGAENEHLPIFMVDTRIVSRATYPDRAQLLQWVGLSSQAPAPVSSQGCGPGCCCG